MSDLEIDCTVDSTKERSREFDKQVLEHIASLKNYAQFLCFDSVLADDLVQSTVTKAFEKHHQFKEGTNLKAWLFVILKSKFLTHIRRKSRMVEDVDGVFSSTLVQPDTQDITVEFKEVMKVIDSLPIHFREIIELITVKGYKLEEIAEMLNISVGTVKSRVHRARSELEHRLSKNYDVNIINRKVVTGTHSHSFDENLLRSLVKNKVSNDTIAEIFHITKAEVVKLMLMYNIDRK